MGQSIVALRTDDGMSGYLYDTPLKTIAIRSLVPATIGRGAFMTAANTGSNVKGAGKFAGFVYNGMSAVNPNIFAVNSDQIPAGQDIPLLSVGSLWVKQDAADTVAPAFGLYVFVKDTDGTVTFQANTTAKAGYTIADGWRVVNAATGTIGDTVVISNTIKLGA